MATLMMAWELGGGLGHVKKMMPVAEALRAHGHRSVFVVKNLIETAPVFKDQPFPVLQAPQWDHGRIRGGRAFRAATFADILAVRGFSDPDDLLALVNAWQGLIDLIRPDLIVADHSPTVCLTAYAAVPVVMMGAGFVVPPVAVPEFPLLQPNVQPMVSQEQLLEVVRQVQRQRGRPAPDTLPGLFAKAERFVCTFPELDPYRGVRQTENVGPLHQLPPLVEPPAEPSYFCYLAGDYAGTGQIVSILARAKLAGSIYLRGAPKRLIDQARTLSLHLYDAPAPMNEVLPRVSAIIHHGGLSTSEEALVAGRPQLLIPRYLEQELTTRALHQLGVATFLAGKFTAQAVSQALHQVIADPRFARQAMSVAQSIQDRGPCDALSKIVARCLEILA